MEVWLQYRAFSRSAPTQARPKPESTGTPEPQPRHQAQAQDGYPPGPGPSHTTSATASTTGTYVGFLSGDRANPQNWSMIYKAWVIAQLTFLTLSLTFASSVSSAASSGARAELGGSELAGTATTGAFVVGIGLGAMPFAPLSELYGRLPVYAVTIVLATLFEIGCGLAPSMGALIVLRFIAGFFSAAPLSNAGGSLNDIGNPVFRTLGLPLFTTTGFVGPILGPIIGSYIAESHLGWRWCYYLTAIWNGASFVLVMTFMPETLGPALLKYKAIAWRRKTGDGEWRAVVEDESLWEALQKSLKRPFVMLVKEPILVFFSVYLTVVYTVLYGLFNSYPIVFSRRNLDPTQIGLTFIPVLVGFFVLFGLTLWHFTRYKRLTHEALEGKRGRIEPEERLIPLMISSILFPAGLFWFAWTSDPKYSIWLTMMSGIPFGFGLLAIFQGSYQYLMDAYGPFAASALASCTLTRYGISGLVVLAYPTMYENLGSEWAGSVFAFLGLALTPVPFLFYIYGRRIRAKCTFTVRT